MILPFEKWNILWFDNDTKSSKSEKICCFFCCLDEEFVNFVVWLVNAIRQSEFLHRRYRIGANTLCCLCVHCQRELLSAIRELFTQFGKDRRQLQSDCGCLNEYGALYNVLSDKVCADISDLAWIEVPMKVGKAVGNI